MEKGEEPESKMEEEKPEGSTEIQETTLLKSSIGSHSNPHPKTVRTKVPEVEVHLYRRGKGPIDKFKSTLGGWDQDQLEARDICDKYGLKAVFAFTPGTGRGAPIRFSPRNGRSMLAYKDGSVVYIDGEPKDSMLHPVTKILVGAAVITLLITLVSKQYPNWTNKLNIYGFSFPPWAIACVVIVFTRMRKRTRDFLKKYGY